MMPYEKYFIGVDHGKPGDDMSVVVLAHRTTSGVVTTSVIYVDPSSTAATPLPWEQAPSTPAEPPKSRAQRRREKKR